MDDDCYIEMSGRRVTGCWKVGLIVVSFLTLLIVTGFFLGLSVPRP